MNERRLYSEGIKLIQFLLLKACRDAALVFICESVPGEKAKLKE